MRWKPRHPPPRSYSYRLPNKDKTQEHFAISSVPCFLHLIFCQTVFCFHSSCSVFILFLLREGKWLRFGVLVLCTVLYSDWFVCVSVRGCCLFRLVLCSVCSHGCFASRGTVCVRVFCFCLFFLAALSALSVVCTLRSVLPRRPQRVIVCIFGLVVYVHTKISPKKLSRKDLAAYTVE